MHSWPRNEGLRETVKFLGQSLTGYSKPTRAAFIETLKTLTIYYGKAIKL